MWLFRLFTAIVVTVLALVPVLPGVSEGGTSVNIPVGSRLYRDLERLEMKGLIDSSILATRPFDRLEGARLVELAARRAGTGNGRMGASAVSLVQRLQNEFAYEINRPERRYIRLKPVSSLYTETLWADGDPVHTDINNDGDAFIGGISERLGFVLTGDLLDAVSIYINPELRADGNNTRVRLLHGYIKLDLSGVSLLAGRESLWWGPAANGNLLVTNNARPFDMLMLTSRRPFQLPWALGRLGLVRPMVFLTRLESARDYPNANLLGMRFDFKVTPNLELGVERVFMFGGEGRSSLDLSDWFNVFIANDDTEHADSPVNGNQIVSINASYRYINNFSSIPFSAFKIYTQWGAEDSSGKTKSPTGRANICGILIDGPFFVEGAELRVEWTNIARNAQYGPHWYGHGIYTTGYRYYGRVIGHHIDRDSKDLFLHASYTAGYATEVGVEAEREWSGVHLGPKVTSDWIAVYVNHETRSRVNLFVGSGFEKIRNPVETENNLTAWARAEWRF